MVKKGVFRLIRIFSRALINGIAEFLLKISALIKFFASRVGYLCESKK